MKKLFTANKYLPVALALAAFTCAAPAFAHSSGARSAGVSTRNARPFVHSGYSSYARVPDYSAIEPSSLGPADRFGEASQR